MLGARHIQDYSNASTLEPHWGYANRVVPCTNDAGSCAYLDVVYASHDRGMIYAGALWSVIGAILLIFALARQSHIHSRLGRTVQAWFRRRFLPEFRSLRWVFGRTTRLQVVVLAATAAYLFVFSFVGMQYAIWVTPVKKLPGVYNTRTTLGPWADRVGLLAYALTPLSILLANRESLLSLCTGIPYHHFNFLHRWIGHIIFAQSILHTIGWCIVEIKLYQPQPTVAAEWIRQPYMIWGVVAMLLMLLLWGLSTSLARRKLGHEFFRKAHYVLAMLYVGACWAHWKALRCFMIPSLLLWLVDRAARLVRTALIHYRIMPTGRGMFETIPAQITQFELDVIRLDLECPNPISWEVGQHFYLTFADGGIWQSHPFTPLSLPGRKQSYVLRAKSGETKRIASLKKEMTGVILTGPYGESINRDLSEDSNVLCIAGGTGICFVLPVLLDLAKRREARGAREGGRGRIELLWVVRSASHADWVVNELEVLRGPRGPEVTITIHSTGSASAGTSVDGSLPDLSASEEGRGEGRGEKDSSFPELGGRPDLKSKVNEFVMKTKGGAVTVLVSGPGGMTSDVRDGVAACNSARDVWRGEGSGEVRLVYDERLE